MEIFQIIVSWLIEPHTFLKLYFFLTTLLRYNLHTIKSTRLKCVIQCFLDCAQIGTTITSYFQNIFITLKKKPIPISYPSLNPHPQIPKQPTTNLLSVSLDFPIWDISHEWNHIIRNFLNWHLSLSTMFSKFQGSCCNIYQYFISLHDLIICQC